MGGQAGLDGHRGVAVRICLEAAANLGTETATIAQHQGLPSVMSRHHSCYLTEESLVADFKASLSAGAFVACASVTEEFDFASGRTDVLVLDPDLNIHAFEAKLTKWKQALHQAWRNSSFAHFTYVVLPARSATAALKAIDEFKKLGVGLILMGDKKPKLASEATKCEPLLPWLTTHALEVLNSNDERSPSSCRCKRSRRDLKN